MTKTLLRECWNVSDTCESFEAALREKGFWLAHGERRSYVAVDWRGEIYSLSRAIGMKKKELAVRLGNTMFLRSVDESNAHIGAQLTPKIQEWAKDAEAQAKKAHLSLTFKTEQMIQRQRGERESLRQSQALRWQSEERARAARTPRGIRGLWGWISGKNKKIRAINEAEIEKAKTRDLAERQEIIRKQINERRRVQQMVMHVRRHQRNTLTLLAADVAKAMAMGRVPESANKKVRAQERSINRRSTRDRGPDYEPNERKEVAMRHTLMINLDEAHALQLDELRQHFKLSAEDTVRMAIRTAHAMQRKGASAPECKPCAAKKPEASPL